MPSVTQGSLTIPAGLPNSGSDELFGVSEVDNQGRGVTTSIQSVVRNKNGQHRLGNARWQRQSSELAKTRIGAYQAVRSVVADWLASGVKLFA